MNARASRNESDDFFENAAMGLQNCSSDGTILRANRAQLDLLGYGRDEYVGRNVVEFHVDQEVIGDVLARLRAGETVILMGAVLYSWLPARTVADGIVNVPWLRAAIR